MSSGRFRFLAALGFALTTAGFPSGCAQSGPIASHRNTVGSLKASVSQLEFDNGNLRKQVADIKSEATRVENELVQEKDANGELSARLDDAKDVIRRQGGDVTALNRGSGAASKASNSTASADDEIPNPAKASPIRRLRGGRKPPSAQIPRVEPPTDSGPGGISPASDDFDPGPQASRVVDDGRWLPVARGRSRNGAVEVR